MNKRGTTLIETVISIFIVSVVVVTFLEALNVGITGTLDLSRKTSALNLAKSQIEYIKSQEYNNSTGAIGPGGVYGLITTNASDITDTINYVISGQVTNVSANQSLQKITVNVSYMVGKQVQLVGYKNSETSSASPLTTGQVVTDVIEEMPFMPTGGFWLWGLYCGYYHVIETTATANISATWRFLWTRDVANLASAGAPWILIYGPNSSSGEPPNWVERDASGDPYKEGFLCRGGSTWCAGCPPNDYATNPGNCNQTYVGDYNPIAKNPARWNCEGENGWVQWVPLLAELERCAANWWPIPPLPILPPDCASDAADRYYCENSPLWYDDNNCDGDCPNVGFGVCGRTNEEFELTVTTTSPVPPGTYTVLFFNGEITISFEDISASITYVH